MKYKITYFVFSLILVVISIVSLSIWKLKPAIDFTGGSILEITTTTEFSEDEERIKIEEAFSTNNEELSSLQVSGDDTWLIRAKSLEESKKNEILTTLEENIGASVVEQRFEVVGPTVGEEVTRKTGIAVLLAVIAILAYVAWISRKTTERVASWKFGIGAVVALLHDSLILVGVFSLLGHFYNVEIDLLVVTAVLTIMSFSVHDTIVVFDRIKETFKKQPRIDLVSAINVSLTETMTRSVNNSMTIVFMLLSLLLLGGQSIFYFVLALLIGTILGTYSSPFIASPIVLLLSKKRSDHKNITH